jgi:hypothetical protein
MAVSSFFQIFLLMESICFPFHDLPTMVDGVICFQPHLLLNDPEVQIYLIYFGALKRKKRVFKSTDTVR